MSRLIYDTIIKYRITAECDGPLHVGSAVGGKEEVLTHPVDGIPFVQASSLAGVCRSYCKKLCQNNNIPEKIIDLLFGNSRHEENTNDYDSRSRIRFEDGCFENNSVKMELRPHVKINRKTGTADSEKMLGSGKSSGQKFNMEYVGAGSVFTFNVYLYLCNAEEESKEYEKLISLFISSMKNKDVCIGAKTSSGAGRLLLKEALTKRYKLKDINGRYEWSIEKPDKKDGMETMTLPDISTNSAYKIIVSGKTEGTIQIKGIAVTEFGKNAPDSENIRNAKKEYIIPGTSVKGVVRSRIESIAQYLGKTALIDDIFGKVSDKGDPGKTGNIMFHDVVIGDIESNDRMPIKRGIHIDKFTGGVFQKGLFSEKNAAGDITIQVDISEKNNPDATLGLLVLALRDLAIGTLSLGNGYSNGKGIIKVSDIEILGERCKNPIKISFGDTGKIADEDGVISKALKLLEKDDK